MNRENSSDRVEHRRAHHGQPAERRRARPRRPGRPGRSAAPWRAATPPPAATPSRTSGESNRLATNDSSAPERDVEGERREQHVRAAARLAQQHRAADGEADDGGDQRGDGLDAQSGAILPRILSRTRRFCWTACSAGLLSLQWVTNAAVLVLNRHYQPIHVTNVRRAFSLLYLGSRASSTPSSRPSTSTAGRSCRAEVHGGHDVIHTVNRAIRVPRVIVLQLYDRIPKTKVRFSRHNIYMRDGNTCQYCGERAAARRAEPRPRRAARPGRPHHLGERRLLLHRLQPVQGRAHAGAGGAEAAQAAAAPALDADLPHQRRSRSATASGCRSSACADASYWNVELED